MSGQQLAEKLHKPIIKNLKKEKYIHSTFLDIILGADLADIRLISKLKKGISMYLRVVFNTFAVRFKFIFSKSFSLYYMFLHFKHIFENIYL